MSKMRWYEWVFMISMPISGVAFLAVIIHSYKILIELAKNVEEILELQKFLKRQSVNR